MIVRRYTFKLYPMSVQEEALHEQARMMANLWNALLQRNEDTYRRTRGQRGVIHAEGKSRLTFFDMTAEITKLRHVCPEWEALSVWSAHRVARSLDNAFKAFFARARSGAGAQSGYPRYRSAKLANSVPHRFASGCRLLPRERSDSDGKARSAREWRLTLKGVDGPIRARGEFPAEVLKWTDADVIFRDGKWWLSVAVEMPSRRAAGEENITVRFDLIDEFARVERADGRRTANAGSARAHEQSPNHLHVLR